ncbi:tetratricopeptide repeat protein [Patescibacteria group bacterium]|nr:tetratricopeptide repeat protein [Patescibacteria group bacterium]
MPKKGLKKRKNDLVFFLSCCGAILILLLALINMGTFFLPKKVYRDLEVYQEQKSFWQEIVSKHPNYLDGWLELANINLLLDDLEEAKRAFEKAREINPNSEKVAILKKKL